MTKDKLDTEIDRIIHADHGDPFSVLGMHTEGEGAKAKLVVRTYQPQARSVAVVDHKSGKAIADLPQIRDEGFFAGAIDGRATGTWFCRLDGVAPRELLRRIRSRGGFPPLFFSIGIQGVSTL